MAVDLLTKPDTREEWQQTALSMAALLIECRDALPALTLAQTKLHNIRLDLADRIDLVLKPWEVKS